jgi:hypothetical protein
MPPPAIPAIPSPAYGLSASAGCAVGTAAALAVGNARTSERSSGGVVQACGAESAPTGYARPAIAETGPPPLPDPIPEAKPAAGITTPPAAQTRDRDENADLTEHEVIDIREGGSDSGEA